MHKYKKHIYQYITYVQIYNSYINLLASLILPKGAIMLLQCGLRWKQEMYKDVASFVEGNIMVEITTASYR